jgi:hypothetical protein
MTFLQFKIANASMSTAVKANPGAFRNWRKASRRSAFMIFPLVTGNAHALGALGHHQLYACLRAAVPFDSARFSTGV